MLHTRVAPEVHGARGALGAATAPRRRVLMVAPTSFFADYGCHVRILEEARALARLEQEVTIVTYNNGRDVPGLTIRRTPPIPWRRGYEVGSSRHKLGFDALLAGRTLVTALRWRPDVIHGHLHEGALIGGVVAKALRRPLVFDFQGSLTAEMVDHGFLDAQGAWRPRVERLERRINGLADAIVTSSTPGARLLVSGFGVPAERVFALPDCVDTERFRPDVAGEAEKDALRAALGIPRGQRVVVYLGLLAHYQGTDLLLEAARRIAAASADVHFLVMGFPGVEVYAHTAVELGLAGRVTFTGRVPYELAPQHLALGDVAVAPKLSATEGSGKILNYMAMGLPTAAFDTPVSREYLASLGRYATPGDAAALAERIYELLADAPGRAELAVRLRARAEESFAWDHAARRIVDVYGALDALPRAA